MANMIAEIIYPSEIKIKISNLTDADGNIIPIEEYPYMKFIFADQFNGLAECIYDPTGIDSKGTKVVTTEDPDTGETETYLYVTVTDYKLKGELKYKVGIRIDDEAFADGKWRWYGEFVELGAKVVFK